MPRDRFAPVLEIDMKCTFSASSNGTKVTERLFMPIAQAERYKEARKLQKEIEWKD